MVTILKKSSPLDELRDRIRQGGLRCTGGRVAVLRALEQAASPLSHAEVAGLIQDQGYDMATTYRNLVDLAEAGLLVRRDLGDHIWRFESRGTGEGHDLEHPHFVCVTCGDVACLPKVTVQVSAGRQGPRALRRRDLQIQIQGECDNCDAAAV